MTSPFAYAGRSARATRIVATGGGVWQNPLLPCLIEERFELPVQVSPQREAAAVGAAMLAEWHSRNPSSSAQTSGRSVYK